MLKEGFQLLEKYKIPIPKYWINELPKDLEFPLAIKADVLHKTDLNAIFLDINNYTDLEKAFYYLKERFPDRDIIIQKQIKGNYVELIVGIKEDFSFDNIILIGIGGIFTEIIKDYIVIVPPFDKEELISLLKNLKFSKILFGYRNKKINFDLLYDIIKKLLEMYKKENIKELEINPLLINEKEAFAVDIRFFTY